MADVTIVPIKNILTRTTGYLESVTSHSAQPYRGCTLGRSLCGVGCYVQHARHMLRGRAWGEFLEVRRDAGDSYRDNVDRERRWARRRRDRFSVFVSSSTEPFPPQEPRHGATRGLLEAMLESPPDALILQTHSHRVVEHLDLCSALDARCQLRVHLSIETDRERLPGLPPHASSVERRLAAARTLRDHGLFTVVTVSPLLPIASPEAFFARIAASADAVVLDHFIGGDGSPGGSRTLRTALPQAMEQVLEGSTRIEYRDEMVAIARRHLPDRTGVGIDGFAGRYLETGDNKDSRGI